MTTGQLLTLAAVVAGVYAMQRYQSKPKGIRNNNPLNIRKSNIQWRGKVGDDGEFEIFDTAHNGIRAAARNLRTYRQSHGLTTVAGIIGRWAPPNENDTSNYSNFVLNRTGLAPGVSLAVSDYPKLVEAMIMLENGQQPYSMNEIEQAVKDGFA